MNITTVASSLDWKTNNKGTWKVLIDDLVPNSNVTFDEGYTTSTTGKMVVVTNASSPIGNMTYETSETNVVNTAPLYGAGTAYDSVEAVAGDKTVKMGSVDLGTLEWMHHDQTGQPYGWWVCYSLASVIKRPPNSSTVVNATSDLYIASASLNGSADSVGKMHCDYSSGFLNINNGSTTDKPTGWLYYELAEPTASTETPQSLSLTTGSDTISAPSFDTTYEGTDYYIPLLKDCKYIFRNSEGTDSLITGSTTNTSIAVTGGVNKLINLSLWFGRTKEPSISSFYKLYPTWKNYNIPYDQGSALNYKGTGVQTIGFNAYNYATGTAALLGGNQYQICGTFTSLSYVDVYGATETITLDSANRFTPVNDGILTVTGGNNTDTLVHLCWSGYKNFGEPEYKYEPFTSNIKDFPVSTYFPEGMNSVPAVTGSAIVYDELTTEQKIKRVGVIDLGTLTYGNYNNTINNTYPWGYVSFTISSKKKGLRNIVCDLFVSTVEFKVSDKAIIGASSNSAVYIVNSDFIGMTGAQIKEALSGVYAFYELATPVVTQLDQPLNLAYPVNDFGTEHSLPQNTTTLVTTDLKALIKYNTDYMRMNSQLAEIFPTVKSLVKQEQDGYIMKIDSYAPNARVGAADNLIDKNAEGTPAEFTYRTSGGDADITDGTAIAKKIKGTTLNLNQLVHDTNQNIVTGNGQVEVEDAVVSDVASLVVSGRSLVKNQLVSPTTERTVNSSDGVIAVNDGIVETPKGLVLTAPRSVVVNQLVQNGDFVDTTGWTASNGTISVGNNVLTFSCTGGESVIQSRLNGGVNFTLNHKYLVLFEYKSDTTYDVMFRFSLLSSPQQYSITYGTADTWQKCAITHTIEGNGTAIWVYQNTTPVIGNSFSIRNMMCVDLTQYFNGDTALIDSITSWDDLVAYDPRFTSYVEYNTGEVAGVQPSVGVNAYMRNQKARAQNTSSSPSSGISTVSKTDRDMSFALTSTNPSSYIAIAGGSLIVGHRYIVTGYATCSYTATFRGLDQTIAFVQTQVIPANTRTRFFLASTVNTSRVDFVLYVNVGETGVNGDTIQIEDLQLIDVTQLRYGYTVPTIANWDDLVAIVPEYANYVAYDTGTVVGTVATSPVPLYGVGTAVDTYDAVTGKVEHKTVVMSSELASKGWDSTAENADGYIRFVSYNWDTGKKIGITNIVSNLLLTSSTVISNSPTDEGVSGHSSVNVIYVALKASRLSGDLSTSTGRQTAFRNWITTSGFTLYYELATPTEELLASSTISLQQGSNVALQTDGGRTAPFSLTYDGTEFTLPLDSTHKYAYSDNGTKSIITSATEQAVTGGQDMLVDVTRMFNGDITAINAVTSWEDMAAVMPEYLSNVAYNEGEVVGRSGGVTTAVWNQLVRPMENLYWRASNAEYAEILSQDTSGIVTVRCKKGAQTNNEYSYWWGISLAPDYRYTVYRGHKYYTQVSIKTSNASVNGVRCEAMDSNGISAFTTAPMASWFTAKGIRTTNITQTSWSAGALIYPYMTSGSTRDVWVAGDTYSIKDYMCIDLTEIYGAGHEPSTVEEFEADCAKWGKDLAQYQPYDAGTPMGGSATFSDLHGVGSVVDTLDVITGQKDVKFGSVDLGSLTWTYGDNRWRAAVPADMKLPASNSVYNFICETYEASPETVNLSDKHNAICVVSASNQFRTYAASSTTEKPSGMLYYELAESMTSSLTPQPLTFAAGLNNVHEQNMDITGTPVTMEYTGTDYTIVTKSARKYIRTVDGVTELVTGVSSVDVRGGRDNLIDLTRMFGAGLEPGTLDAFYSLFPTWMGYRLPYNKGSLLNFKGTGLKSVGFNQFSGVYSEEGKYLTSTGTLTAITSYNVTDYLRAVPGQTYRLTAYGNAPSLCWYTYDKTFISGTAYGHASTWQEDVFTAPANAYWVRFSVYMPRETETCFYFQWSGTRNGDYEPYWDYVRPLPTLTYFPDGMNGRGSVYDEINPRQAVKRFGKVDLGTLEWSHTNSGTYGYWESNGIASSIMKPADHSTIVPMVSSLYVATNSNNVSSGTDDYLDYIGVRATSGNIRVNNGSATESPTGWLVYELATPVVTTFPEEISATARISDYGTEECLPTNGYVPTTAPFRGIVLYQDDYARTITKLPENYQSQNSMENLLTLLGSLHNGTFTATFDSANQVYTYQFTPNE